MLVSVFSPFTRLFGRRADIWPGLSLLLAGALLIMPGAPTSAFGGTPLSNPARAALVILLIGGAWLLLFRTVRAARPWVTVALLALCLVKAVSANIGAPSGWRAEYDMLDKTPARATFFWRFGAHAFRLEPEIALEGTRPGMHFLNALRYSHGLYVPALREQTVPLRITWSGLVPASAQLSASLSARGTVRVMADGHELGTWTDPSTQSIVLPATSGGPIAVHVVYDKPADVLPLAVLRWSTADGPAPAVAPDAAALARAAWEPAARRVTTLVCVIGLVLCFIQLLAGTMAWPLRPRAQGSVVGALAVLAVAGYFAWQGYSVNQPFVDRGAFMSDGNDPLGYEGAARDVMEFGLLMNSGRPHGSGQPFAFYPFYPYVLAGVHWLIGDDGGAIFLANAVFVASTLLLLWFLGWSRLPGTMAAVAALAFGLFLHRHVFAYTAHAFTDNLYLPMVFAALAAVVWAVRTGAVVPGILAGVICALGAETRPSLLTLFPILLPLLLFGLRAWTLARRVRLIALLMVGFLLGVAPFAVRNRIVSGQTVLVSSSWIQLPLFLVPPAEAGAVMARFPKPPTPTESLTAVAEIVRAHPWRSLTTEIRKVLFTFGFTNLAGIQDVTLKPEFVLATAMGLIALLRRDVPSPVALIGVAFALSHLAAMVTATPWTYGYKSILPFQALTLFWAPFLLRRFAAAPVSAAQPSWPHTGAEASVR